MRMIAESQDEARWRLGEREQAEAKFNAALSVEEGTRKQVGTMLILTVEEIEILDCLALRYSREDVIRDYPDLVTANPRDTASSFRGFVCNSGTITTPRPSATRWSGNVTRRPGTTWGLSCNVATQRSPGPGKLTLRLPDGGRSEPRSARTARAGAPWNRWSLFIPPCCLV
jgi:hypothetical protein